MLQYTSKPEPRGGGRGESVLSSATDSGITLVKALYFACPAEKQRLHCFGCKALPSTPVLGNLLVLSAWLAKGESGGGLHKHRRFSAWI